MNRTKFGIVAAAALLCASAVLGCKPAEPLGPSKDAVAMDKAIDWTEAKLIVVQDAGRYKALDSFAREAMSAMTGKESFPGLTPVASLFEWLFNRDAYLRTPLVLIRDQGLRYHFSAHIRDDVVRKRINETGKMSPGELDDRAVVALIEELEPKATMVNALRRVRSAQAVVKAADRMTRIVPQPGENKDAGWLTVDEIVPNLPDAAWTAMGFDSASARRRFGEPAPGVSADQALAVVPQWFSLREAWLKRDADGVKTQLSRLAEALPNLAAAGVYPEKSQRQAEARYYAMNKMIFSWIIYLFGTLVGVYALVTKWRGPWLLTLAALVVGLGLHTYGIALRWQIVGRIPNANMFEALTFSAWVGILLTLALELCFRSRIFVLAGNAAGFFCMVVAGFIVPGEGSITTIMGILDDLMLRIHTVLIIASYALIFIASVIALLYLFGYYMHKSPGPSMQSGFVAMIAGLLMTNILRALFDGADPETNYPVMAGTAALRPWLGVLAALLVGLGFGGRRWRIPGVGLTAIAMLAVMCVTFSLGHYGFAKGIAWTMAGVGLAWGGLTGLSLFAAQRGLGPQLAAGLAGAGGGPMALGGALGEAPAGMFMSGVSAADAGLRPILAGAAPGDERRSDLPGWLHVIDWSHLIILNIVVITLFIGTILGAVWADYSWGRPWGWDPKEVFALNTWIIYAILVHVRFVVKERGLWTAWLSVAGCLMMAFNWCFVNFYMVGLHSYA